METDRVTSPENVLVHKPDPIEKIYSYRENLLD